MVICLISWSIIDMDPNFSRKYIHVSFVSCNLFGFMDTYMGDGPFKTLWMIDWLSFGSLVQGGNSSVFFYYLACYAGEITN